MENERIANKKTRTLPWLVALVAALFMVIVFFLPLASAKDDYKKYLNKYADEINSPGLDMTNEDGIHVTMLEFVKIYSAGMRLNIGNDATAIIVIVFIALVGVLSLFMLLFAYRKKPIATIVFQLLTFGAFYLLTWDFKDRGVVPSGRYAWGCGYYLYYIGLAVVLVSIIWAMVADRKSKNAGNEAGENSSVTE